ncbi:MAG: NAD(P)/FAD-dependent oxidoreductase [Chloroflexi bacterium HGW-Chloroflexi-4]|jgi:phytoene dehydrogenase-like protein|nr:MAG: NAD(P)/FAD-dependent oxidoreductase [Chloroflexi bacterium HGW-Chloroflexi-4]
MKYDVIIIGGGIAGLTSAAFIAKAGRSVLLCEKEPACGGLLNTFERDGFFFDGGIRATENSGVLFPMLNKLDLKIDFVPNKISVGVEDRVIRINDTGAVETYQDLLNDFYPENKHEIGEIINQIKKIMAYMEVQYGIDNPMFLDIKEDRNYFIKEILPWMMKYAITAPKISKLQEPVVDFLRRYTQNQSLLDIICQHFFQETPAFFALSYVKLYLEYQYPLGGIGMIVKKMVEYIENHGGIIKTNTTIVSVDPEKKIVTEKNGAIYEYDRLIWAADQKALYRSIEIEKLANENVKNAISSRKALIEDKTGNDSVLTLFLALNREPEYFARIASEHFFYTPSKIGLAQAGPLPLDGDQKTIKKWLEDFFALTTYEISCPVMRDATMAPRGKTGLIISTLFDYSLTKKIDAQGWYDEFKTLCETLMIKNLENSIYPHIEDAVILKFSSTPLTLAKTAGNTDGAIVGWAFNNKPVPAESRIPKILQAVKTPVPGVLQAGQWTYSPAGLPISILTGKIAADQVIKDLK